MSRSDARVPYPVAGGCQSITTSGTTARIASDLPADTRHILIAATEAAHYAIGGDSVVATTADTYIPAGGEHFVQAKSGQRVAAIQSTAAGTVFVSAMAH